jgi:hypothetical protein
MDFDRKPGTPVSLPSNTKSPHTILIVLIGIVACLLFGVLGYYVGNQNTSTPTIINKMQNNTVLYPYENTTYVIMPGQAYQNLKIGVSVMCIKKCQVFRVCDSSNNCKDSECKDWPADTAANLQAALAGSNAQGAYVQMRECQC